MTINYYYLILLTIIEWYYNLEIGLRFCIKGEKTVFRDTYLLSFIGIGKLVV